MLTFFSCLGENPWEDLESDYDHVLNVFGLVSLDSLQPSYVGLYSTTNLDEVSRIFAGVDTLGRCDCDDDECGDGGVGCGGNGGVDGDVDCDGDCDRDCACDCD